MTQDNKKPEGDIVQITHENDANAKRILAFGKTTSSTYVPLAVLTDGSVVPG